ncbi:MAG: stage III sporulation protein AB [Bacteroides sp.]|nr:stage III sporulation protein AB [Eubacterium sp.]MCM1418825.1 stage III sporulation protein AB [Roseburia sp.]MCM1462099.1 stage III sporulation protein AB [Bacteroides sp.]
MSERLKKRVEQLRLLIGTLEECSALMRYRALPTDELIRALCARPALSGSAFLRLLGDETEGETALREAWSRAAEEAPYFSEDDRRILFYLGERLGTTDSDGQLSLFALCRTFAEKNLADAEEAYRGKGTLVKKTAILCGAAAAILIL